MVIGQYRSMVPILSEIPVLVVGFRNPADVARCLHALGRMAPEPGFAVFVCENGGAAAFDALITGLTASDGPCATDPDGRIIVTPRFVRTRQLRLRTADPIRTIAVWVAEAHENLGYAGGVNAWLEPLLGIDGWPGVWVVNPDTEPLPDALKELVAFAASRGRGMVGSRLVSHDRPDIVQTRGLAWRQWRAATMAVDRLVPATEPAVDAVERRLDAPSGASIYVTRDCVRRIGLMDEQYFLYFEDLDWGLRAKRLGPIGYAHRSVVLHEGGTTIGSGDTRRRRSALAAYLDFRNRLLFVRRHFACWLPWTVLLATLEILELAAIGAFSTASAAARGLGAGLLGRRGRPDAILRAHLEAAVPARLRPSAKQRVKVAVSACFFVARGVARMIRPPRTPALTVLYYHAVRASEVAGFERQMQALARWARVVPADWAGDVPANSPPLVAITFDDAFESVFDHALPVLARHGFPSTIFVPTGNLGRPPAWRMETDADRDQCVTTAERLTALSDELVTLGSHGMTHRHLSALPAEIVNTEVAESREHLAALIRRNVQLFAFPYGDHDAAAIALCRECGYRHVFTIEPAPVMPGQNEFVRGRVAVDPTDGGMEFLLKARGCYRWMPAVSTLKRKLRRLLPSKNRAIPRLRARPERP